MSKTKTIPQPNTQQVGKNTIVVTPIPGPAIDLSNGESGYKGPIEPLKKEDMYNAGGSAPTHKGAPSSQTKSTKKKKKRKKKGGRVTP